MCIKLLLADIVKSVMCLTCTHKSKLLQHVHVVNKVWHEPIAGRYKFGKFSLR